MASVITLPLGRARRSARPAAQPRRAPGASAPSPRRLPRVAAACALLGLTAWGGVRGWDALSNPRVFPVRQVQIGGTFRHLTPARLKAALAGAVHGSFFTVDVGAVRAAVDALPWVHSASVRRVWPGTLVVRVIERIPVARWGDHGLITAHGTVFRPARIGDLPAMPVLDGPQGSGGTVLRRYRQYTPLLAAVGLKLARLHLSARRSWRMETAGGIRIELGRDDPTQRLQRFLGVYPAVFAARSADIETVDLRYTNGFAVRWKPGTAAPAASGRG